MSVYLGRGSKGRLVAQMQRALGVDQTGSYGPRTESAVRRWQREHGRTDTGVVTTQEWTAITGQAWPPPFVVHTQLVAAIEGHGYRHPAGDYDHAGITWGLIGFTLLNTVKNKEGVAKSSTGGSLYRLFQRLYADAALWDLVKAHFTVAGAAEFARVLNLDGADTATDFWAIKKWARKQSTPLVGSADDAARARASKKEFVTLVTPWKERFEALGDAPEIQAEQEVAARREYFDRAYAATSADYGLPAKGRELQFVYDLLVNNGNLKAEGKAAVRTAIAALGPDATTTQKLLAFQQVMLERFAKHAHPQIIERKGTIARRIGVIHQTPYNLAHWGIEESEAPPPRVLNLSLNAARGRDAEEIAFCEALKHSGLVRVDRNEEIVADAERMQAGYPNKALRASEVRGRIRVDLSGLSQHGGVLFGGGAVPEKADRHWDLLDALLLNEPVHALAIGGRHSALHTAKRSYVATCFAQESAGKPFAGFGVADDGTLEFLFRAALPAGKNAKSPLLQSRDLHRVRSSLLDCELLLIAAAWGVPYRRKAGGWEDPLGLSWQQLLSDGAHRPLVLGWYGLIDPPERGTAVDELASKRFVAALVAIAAGHGLPQDERLLSTLTQTHTAEVLHAWGAACHAAYAGKAATRGLWNHHPEGPELAWSGCGAIAPDGRVYVANPAYDGVTGQSLVLREVTP